MYMNHYKNAHTSPSLVNLSQTLKGVEEIPFWPHSSQCSRPDWGHPPPTPTYTVVIWLCTGTHGWRVKQAPSLIYFKISYTTHLQNWRLVYNQSQTQASNLKSELIRTPKTYKWSSYIKDPGDKHFDWKRKKKSSFSEFTKGFIIGFVSNKSE